MKVLATAHGDEAKGAPPNIDLPAQSVVLVAGAQLPYFSNKSDLGCEPNPQKWGRNFPGFQISDPSYWKISIFLHS